MQRINSILTDKIHCFLRSISLLYLLSFVSVKFDQIFAQCPGADLCNDAYVFCSLDQMNNFSCNTPGGLQNVCSPNCASGGLTNRTWWAFVSEGGDVGITLSVGGCAYTGPTAGLVLGIWGDCNCGEKILCNNAYLQQFESKTYQVNLKPCKEYYISIDSGDDNCDFTINTSVGGASSLSDINNVAGGIIEPVCAGICNYQFFVDPPSTCHSLSFAWTLDGKAVGGTGNKVNLGFQDEGDFVICVTSNSDVQVKGKKCPVNLGQKCATVKVRQLSDITGEVQTVCYGYRWHSQDIFKSGTYHEEFKDKNCCKYDSVIEFIVLPQPETQDVYFISCNNKPFIDILGRSYSSCKDHVNINLPKTTDLFKCDSSIRLTMVSVDYAPQWEAKCLGSKVGLSPNISLLQKCNIGESYKFDYKWYKKNDTLKQTISTVDSLIVDPIDEDYCLDVSLKVHLGTDSAICIKTFCDSIFESKSGNSTQNIKLSYCDSAVINGQTFIQSTQFTQQLLNIFGCDSIIVTELNITKSSTTTLVLKSCDSININGKLYDQSGKYSQILVNTNICDSILNLDLTIPKSNKVDLPLSACDSIVVNGKTYYQSGLYPQLFQNVNFCDSTVNLDLTISKSPIDSFSFNACDPVFFNGKTYTKSGDYPESYISSNGCDSIVNVHINITNSNTSPYIVSFCDSVTINGSFYDQSGSYSQKLKSANGCDSILNIELTIGKNNASNYKLTSCDSALINSQWYYQSGIYYQTLQNSNHCDSTLNIDLNITNSTRGDTIFRSCDSVQINGQIYKQTGIYTQTLTNANQCDSILIIDFIRLSKSSTALNYKSCDSIVVNNQIYKQSGNYSQTFVNANQCDSILNLDVTITKSNATNISLSSCDSILVNGQIYKQSGLYIQHLQNVVQCDSVLNIDLTIHKNSTTNRNLSSCDSVVINNWVYTLTGSYKQFLTDQNGCDSTLNLLVNISNSSASNLALTGCDSVIVNNQHYTLTGVYKQLLTNANGCDSTLKLDLTIKPGNPSTLKVGPDTSICNGEIIQLNGIFSPNSTVGTKFLWHSTNGSFDSPNSLITNYYTSSIGDERIYLQAADDCKQWLDSLTIRVLPKQIVQVTGDTILNPCKEISFTASGGTNYIWTPSSLIECLDPACSRVKLKSTTTLRFTISTDGPCVVPANLNLSLSQIQTDVFLPNVFSPNGDNINDDFLPIFNCEQVDYYNLQIFDRWGNLLFESTTKEKGWNGKYQDQNMNPGVYPYVVQYELHDAERKVMAGDVTLVR